MHFHTRKAFRLHRLAVYSILIAFFILGFSPGISVAVDGEQVGCWWTDSNGVNHNSCGSGSSTSYSGEGFVALGEAFGAFLERILFPPPDPYADARKKRMIAAWTRGVNFHNRGQYFSARDEYNFALKNCDKRKNCNKLRTLITKTYRDDLMSQALSLYQNNNYKQAKNKWQLAYQYCGSLKDKTCKHIIHNIHMMDATIIRNRGVDLENRKYWALALQEYEKSQKICKQYKMDCPLLKIDIFRIKMNGPNEEGIKLFNEGRFTEAKKKYQLALRYCKNKEDCKIIENNILRAKGKIAYNKQHIPNIQGIKYRKNGQYKDAIKYFKIAKTHCTTEQNCKIIDGNLQRAEAWNDYSKGVGFVGKGELTKAKSYYEKALKKCVGDDCTRFKNNLFGVRAAIESGEPFSIFLKIDKLEDDKNYIEVLELYEKIRNKCQSADVCTFLDERVRYSRYMYNAILGDQYYKEENFKEALFYYKNAYKDCSSSRCTQVLTNLINKAENQHTNQPITTPTPSPAQSPNVRGDYYPSFEEIIRNEFDNMEGRMADVPGGCVLFCPDGRNTNNEDLERIDTYLADAILGKLPEQQKLDDDLENGNITPEEWRDGSAAADRNSLDTLGKLGTILEEDATAVRDQWAGLQGQIDAGQITPEQGNELAAGYGAALGNIEDKQDGVEAATDATVGRINLLPPVYDDEEE